MIQRDAGKIGGHSVRRQPQRPVRGDTAQIVARHPRGSRRAYRVARPTDIARGEVHRHQLGCVQPFPWTGARADRNVGVAGAKEQGTEHKADAAKIEAAEKSLKESQAKSAEAKKASAAKKSAEQKAAVDKLAADQKKKAADKKAKKAAQKAEQDAKAKKMLEDSKPKKAEGAVEPKKN